MSSFTMYTPGTAPEGSRELLKKIEDKFGFLPNIFGFMAASPTALQTFPAINDMIEKTSLSPAERQVALLAVSVENDCGFCTAVHSTVARKSGVPNESVNALREGGKLPDAKLNALATFTRTLVRTKGHVPEKDLKAFMDAGYSQENALDVVVCAVVKTFTNYVNNMTQPPLNEQFKAEEWSPKQKKAA